MEAEILECFSAIKQSPHDKSKYMRLVSVLGSDEQMKEELYSARLSMANQFHLSNEEWDQWLSETSSINRKIEILQLNLQDNPTSSVVWAQLIDMTAPENQSTILQKALRATKFDLSENYRIYDRVLLFSEQNDTAEQRKSLFHSLLSIPHLQLDDTLNKCSSFISEQGQENYEQEMTKARQIYTKSTQLLDFIQTYEVNAMNESLRRLPSFWIDYLNLKGNKYWKQPESILGIFERAVRNATDPNFIPVWETVIRMLYELDSSIVPSLVTRFTKRYPTFAQSWTLYVRSLATHQLEDYETARQRIMDLKLITDTNIPFIPLRRSLIMSLISFASKVPRDSSIDEDFQFYFKYALKQNDASNSTEKMVIDYYDLQGDKQMVLRLLENLTNDHSHGTKAGLWVYSFQYHLKYVSREKKVLHKFLKSCLSHASSTDRPQELVETVWRYALLHYDPAEIASIERLMAITESHIAHTTSTQWSKKRRHSEDHLVEDVDDSNATEEGKKQRSQDTKTRDREHLTLLVKNLPSSITDRKLISFFKGCEPINEIIIIEGPEPPIKSAKIEFGTTQALLAAMTKNYKLIGDHEVQIEQAFNTTVWVTNFPPKADKDWLHDLFSKYGEVVSVRLPSLKTNVRRRFCYVEFSNSKDAYNTVKNLHDLDVDGYKLVVKISNPDVKQERSGATEEGREVYVSRIDFYKTGKEKLMEVFGKYGEVEKINLPLTPKNAQMGKIHDGYGFVIFKEAQCAAESADELNNSNLDGRIITVSIAETRKQRTRQVMSQPQQQAGQNTSAPTKDVILSKTLVITNISEKTRPEQLSDIISQFGPLRKLDFQAGKNQAVVEFSNLADAGAAQLKLSGCKIDGQAIDVTDRKSITSNGSSTRGEDGTPTGTMNRRQRRALLQQQQKQQGQPAHQVIEKEHETAQSQDHEETTGLSNNDFRAMLLGSRKS